MSRRERLSCLLLWVGLGVLPLLLRPFWEPDEARYAEIPREMLASGDWITPTLNGVAYFEKPPLQYWLSALSMKAFGLNALAARLPLALASALAMWAAWRLARRLGAERPLWAPFIAATGLLGYACGQVLTLDALFAAFVVAALAAAAEAVQRRARGARGLAWSLLAYVLLAAATLVKGPAALVICGGTLLASLLWTRRARALRRAVLATLFDPFGWMLLLACVAPWFVAVERANPGHARFFFVHEHFARFLTHVHEREGSANPVLDKLYFLGVLAVGLLPWLAATCGAAWRGWRFAARAAGPEGPDGALHRWTVGFLLCAAAVPLAFFSLSGSKLPPYVLPVLVPIAVLVAAFAEEARLLRGAGRELLGLGALMVLVVPALVKEQGGLPWILAVGCAFLLLGCWSLRPRGLTPGRWMAGLGAACLLLTLAAQGVVGRSRSVIHLVDRAPRDAQWMSIGYYYQGIAFRTGRRVTVVAGAGELGYGRDRLSPAERERWFPSDPDAAAARLRAEAPERPVWAIAEARWWARQAPERRAAWEEVASTRVHRLLRLR